jgi:BirA family biotin operon repressor/biotin-[acetyl-CoA-carboxylase] ligase
MIAAVPIELWPERLEAAAARTTPFRRVTVLRQTDSTQDAARRQASRPGDVIVAWRQTAGRGRRGRSWADTGEEGLAATFVVGADRPERLAIAAALGAALAIEDRTRMNVGIKWPNDLMIGGKKLAGILIEQSAGIASIGIGINVNQRSFSGLLARSATSLAQACSPIDRLQVLESLMGRLASALRLSDDDLARQFALRDSLAGTIATFRAGGKTITGTVRSIDPTRGLVVEVGQGIAAFIPAAATTLVSTGGEPDIASK